MITRTYALTKLSEQRKQATKIRAFIKNCPLGFLQLPWLNMRIDSPVRIIIREQSVIDRPFSDLLDLLHDRYADCKAYFPNATYKLIDYNAVFDGTLYVNYKITLQEDPEVSFPVRGYIKGTDEEIQEVLNSLSDGKCQWTRETVEDPAPEKRETYKVVCSL